MADVRGGNRGPGAAAENRAALIAAARDVFASGGLDAPLSAVARKAGVGQGSLYRHFPDRTSLALAVFSDNITELERLAAKHTSTLDDLLVLITEQTIASTAFIDMLTFTADDPRLVEIQRRLTAVLAEKLIDAQHAGLIRDSVTADDLNLAISMLAGVLARTAEPARRSTAEHAWTLLRRSIGS